MLWKLLSQDDLFSIFFDQKSGKFSKNAMVNCDQTQLDEVIKRLNDKQIELLNAVWLEMLYVPPAETIRDLEKELESEAKVQQSTPKILASTERPGEAGREITQIIQLGKCMVPSCQLEELNIGLRRYQILYHKRREKQNKLYVDEVVDIDADPIPLSSFLL